MITRKSQYYMGIKYADPDLLKGKSKEVTGMYFDIYFSLDRQFDYMNKFMGNPNSSNFKEIVDGSNAIDDSLNELAGLDNELFQSLIREETMDKVIKEWRILLQGKSYFPVILDTMGEDWYRKELRGMGLDFDRIQNYSKDRRYS